MPTKVENIAIEGIMSPIVFAAPSAIQKRDDLLEAAKTVILVTDATEAETAVDMLRQLKEFSDTIEVSRKEVKEPIDKVAKLIQDTARDLTEKIGLERGRLDRMVGDWNRKQQEIAQRERDKALAEEQRILEENQQKIIAAQEAGASLNKLGKMADKAFEQIAVAKAATLATAAPTFAGVSTRATWEYEVEDYAALYAAHPTAVKMAPVDAIIKALLKQTKGKLPGVTARQVNRTVVS